MSTAQSVPASEASKSQVDATTQAVEALVQNDRDDDAVNAEDELDDEEHDDEQQADGEGQQEQDDLQAGTSATGAAAKKKKKKSKSKGKGKATLDKLKSVLTGGDTETGDSSLAASVAGKKTNNGISDDLYKRILAEAQKNLPADEVAKLDRQAISEMVECEADGASYMG